MSSVVRQDRCLLLREDRCLLLRQDICSVSPEDISSRVVQEAQVCSLSIKLRFLELISEHNRGRPAETGADRRRPGESPDMVSSTPRRTSPSTRKGQDYGSSANSLKPIPTQRLCRCLRASVRASTSQTKAYSGYRWVPKRAESTRSIGKYTVRGSL